MRLGSFSNIYSCVSKNEKFNYFALIMNEAEKGVIESSLSSQKIEDNRWFRDGDYAYLKITEVSEVAVDDRICIFDIESGSVTNHLLSYK